jgi:branched-chain amino acid aminotransferase group I
MPWKTTEKIWHNGKHVNWEDAHIHVLSHCVSYGSAVFEGIRCYKTDQGPAIFRLREHMQRLLNSGHIYRIDAGYSVDDLASAAVELVRVNGLDSCYIRPVVLRGYGAAGVDPDGCPIEVYMACWEWGKYLGEEALRTGVDVCVSSWTRPAPNTLPQMAKAAANYMNSQLIRMEARVNGYVEGIALDVHGYVSEGSGENIFLVDGRSGDHPAAFQFRAAGHHPQHHRHAVPRFGHSRSPSSRFPAKCCTSRRKFSSWEPPRKLLRFARSIASRSAPALVAPLPTNSRTSSSPTPRAANRTFTGG